MAGGALTLYTGPSLARRVNYLKVGIVWGVAHGKLYSIQGVARPTPSMNRYETQQTVLYLFIIV